jgi:hypothetical protein
MRNSRSMTGVLALLLLSRMSDPAHGLTLSIGNRSYAGGNQAAFDALADSIENQFNSTIATGPSQAEFLTQVGNANAMSSRGYVSPGAISGKQRFFMSVSGSGAVALGEGAKFTTALNLPQNQIPNIGFSAKGGVSIGVGGSVIPKFLPLDPSKTTFSASFFSTDRLPFRGSRFSLASTQASVGMSYQLDVPKALGPLLRFNGFKLTSGLSYSVFEGSYRIPFQLTASSGGSSMSWSDDVTVGIQSKVFSVSNEIVTGVRAFWIATVYTGVGMDLNFGSSSITGQTGGQVSGSGGGGSTFTGTASITGEEVSRAPTWVQFRYLAGTQFDLGPVGVFIQGQMATPAVYGLNIGAHFAL